MSSADKTRIQLSQPVSLVRSSTYSRKGLADCIEQIMFHLERPSFSGKTVLLKPNLISSRGPALACTNGIFLAAVADWFLAQGARVHIGDSPAFGTLEGVLSRQGIGRELDGLNVHYAPFTDAVEHTLASGVKIQIARQALNCDYLINLPKIKAHSQMYLTGAVKNLFGTVVGMRKAMMHMQHGGSHANFARILLAIIDLLPPMLHLADGVEVMHVTGPLDGKPLKLGCVAGSACPVALDTAFLELLELQKESSPLYRAAVAENHPGSRVQNLVFPILQPTDFNNSGFLAPENLNPIRFNPLRFLLGNCRRLVLAFRH